MTTVQINERTKDGKALLEFLKNYSSKSKGVEIIKPTKKAKPKEKDYPISKNVPNAETLKAMRETKERKGLSKPKSLDEFLKEIET